ncbi:uncharacterized protein LOC118770865 isoform X2 [Megalops cyprinoides]|uniref:uncharacterized protein LOC118770865 isoform X2 n=1 Tax=Megalops cyprinoides TaxID=118141 RepID=UPI001864E0D4|nr:uncharacterized protein LOC118770865 isoform X2 [Megalops cyprinoides]
MSSQRDPPFHAMDRTKPDQLQVDSTTGMALEGCPGAGRGVEKGAGSHASGEPQRGGKGLRWRKRSSHSEGHYPAEEDWSPEPSPGLLGLWAEPVWFGRGPREQAEGPSLPLASQTSCHRQVRVMWMNTPSSDPAEQRSHPNLPAPSTPSSLTLMPTLGTPDEEYLSLGPSPGPPQQRPSHAPPRGSTAPPRDASTEKPHPHLAVPTYRQRPHSQPRLPVAGHAHGHGHAHNHGHTRAPNQWRRGPRGQGVRRKRWNSEADADSPRQQYRLGPGAIRPGTMSAAQCLAQEKIWFDKSRYDEAERRFYEGVNGPTHGTQESGANTILQDIARARENIQKSLAGNASQAAGDQSELVSRMRSLELENQNLHNVVEDLRSALSLLESRVAALERTPAAAPSVQVTSAQQPKVRAPVEEEDDDDLDLFGSDEEEDEEAERIREERVKEYSERKSKKPAIIAKSSILLDVKPWDDETDMVKLEECVRSVQADGLLWGSSKLVPVGYGIKKLQIQCVVEDDKVGTDMLEEEITKFEDYVQSVDVAAFNKI